MKIWGLTIDQAREIAANHELVLYNEREDGRAISLTLRPTNERFRKINPRTNRRVWAVCWHGHYFFMYDCFLNGATRIKSTMADYRSPEQFHAQAPYTGHTIVGPPVYPYAAHETCDCAMTGDYILPNHPPVAEYLPG